MNFPKQNIQLWYKQHILLEYIRLNRELRTSLYSEQELSLDLSDLKTAQYCVKDICCHRLQNIISRYAIYCLISKY